MAIGTTGENIASLSIIHHYFKQFFRKYFLEGQKYFYEETTIIQGNQGNIDELFVKYRKVFGFLIPFVSFQAVYWLLAFRYHFYDHFEEKYTMTIVMIFGSLIGGMTAEGGGAVAFPVMTLILNISPTVARDFSFMTQSCGLTATSFTIFFTGILVEWHSIIFSSIGAIFGVVFGLEVVDPLMTSDEKKITFVAVFFSFAIALFILNSEENRKTFNKINQFTLSKAIILIVNGFIGGIFTGISGSGVDVYSFSILTLFFRISEKVATPTSVVLMAANSLVGFFWRQFMQNEIEKESWEYLSVCLPVVVIFAPVGGFLATYLHRLTLASLIYILETVALVNALIIIKPNWPLIVYTLVLIIGSLTFYMIIARYGRKLLEEKTKSSEMRQRIDEKSVTSSAL